MASNIDPAAESGSVKREVQSGNRDGQVTRTTIARRTYPTDQADLWDALTNADRIPRWFLPVSGDLSLGGRYQLEGNAEGVIEECDEPTSLGVTWEFAGQVSWVRVVLSSTSAGTELELAHEGPVDEQFWATYGAGAGGVGWDLGLMALALHIESGESVDPEAAQAFTYSPAGIDFVTRAAQEWAQAAIADGDEPEAARAAAKQTVSFYTELPGEESTQ